MSHSLVDRVTTLLRETGHDHHQAFIETDGADPEWPIWYAEYLVEKLPPLIGSSITRSKIVHLIMSLEEIRLAEAPDEEWQSFYAERLAGWAESAGSGRAARLPDGARVTGLGGIFFKSADPARLKAWYKEHLGIVPQADGSVIFEWTEKQDPENNGFTVWGPFAETTDYFSPSTKPFMFNFRVDDLRAILERLRKAGVEVDDKVEDYPYGSFGWAMDPEGNRIELWEPR